MKDPRKTHVEKTGIEKELYRQMLQSQNAEDPTYEAYESSSTNSVSRETKGKSSITEPSLRPYRKESNYPIKEIVIGIIVFAATTILFLFGMSLNREIGVLTERTNNINTNINELKSNIGKVEDKLSDLSLDVNLLKNYNNNSGGTQPNE